MKKELINIIKNQFVNTFHKEPILIFSPGRINIIGEHTDYNEGFVFPAAIDLGVAIAIQKSNNKQSRVFAYDKDEHLTYDSQKPIKPIENGGWKNYVLGVFIELQDKNINISSFDLIFGGNIPGGAGLSSSAAIENGIIYAVNHLYNLHLSKKEMILISQKAEQNSVGVNCGIMDQYASMFGEEQCALLLDCSTVVSKKIHISLSGYELLLINSNVKHNLAEDSYNDRRRSCEKIASALNVKSLRYATKKSLQEIESIVSPENYEKAIYVIEENERVLNAEKAIENNDFYALGMLLYESHEGLKNLYKVSCDEIDFLVDATKNNPNVLGARMIGGGFGGCTLNLIKTGKVEEFLVEVLEKFKNKFGKPCTPISVKISQGTSVVN